MVYQKWREYEWVHQLTIISPEGDKNNIGLLFINGGGNNNGEPNWRGRDDDALISFTLHNFRSDFNVYLRKWDNILCKYGILFEIILNANK
jgi:hypothetical protein